MALLGTSSNATGSFYADKARQTSQALAIFADRLREKQERKRQQEMAEINRFVERASSMPELADTWGADISNRYGSKYPEVAPMVEAIKKRNEIAKFVPAAGEKWLSEWQGLEQSHAQRGQDIQGMPDAVPMGYGGATPFGGFQLPNFEKQQAQEEYGQVDPAYLPAMAAEKLSPKERLAAGVFAKQYNYDIPSKTAFDPFKQLPGDVAGVLAAQRGYLTGETAEAARVAGKMRSSPAAVEARAFSREEREARETSREDDREARTADAERARIANDKLVRGRLAYQDSLSRARESRRVANDRSLIEFREGFASDPDALNWKDLASDSEKAQRDYDTELSQTLKGVSTGKKASEAKTAFIRERGTRPKALSATDARRIANEAKRRVKAGEIEPEAVLDEAEAISADYMARTSAGMAPEKAIKSAIAREPIPESVPVTRQAPACSGDALQTA